MNFQAATQIRDYTTPGGSRPIVVGTARDVIVGEHTVLQVATATMPDAFQDLIRRDNANPMPLEWREPWQANRMIYGGRRIYDRFDFWGYVHQSRDLRIYAGCRCFFYHKAEDHWQEKRSWNSWQSTPEEKKLYEMYDHALRLIAAIRNLYEQNKERWK